MSLLTYYSIVIFCTKRLQLLYIHGQPAGANHPILISGPNCPWQMYCHNWQYKQYGTILQSARIFESAIIVNYFFSVTFNVEKMKQTEWLQQ